jgi:peptide/nickel transport system substrate-binding protein
MTEHQQVLPAGAGSGFRLRRRRAFARTLLVAGLVGILGSPACRRAPQNEGPTRLVATIRQEPRSFNRFVAGPTAAVDLIALLTQGTLVRVNRPTGELEPRLATSWSLAPDGVTYTLELRPDVAFSDGMPFTSADVVFTFAALYDPRVASPMATSFQFDGKPLRVEAVGDRTVRVIFPTTYGPGLTILDSLPILPRHKLETALKGGTFAGAWSVSSPVTDVVGLGPFVLSEYISGQGMRFTRNPRFWKAPLPRVDEVEVQIVPEQNAEVLRLQTGQTDVMYDFARPEDLPSLREAARAGTIKLADAGVEITPNALWFDLSPGAPRAKDRPWLQREEFRTAISAAVDRKAIVDTVYLGEAVPIFGPVTPGHQDWHVADLPKMDHDQARAKALLASIGLTDRNGDGMLEDVRARPVRFSILTLRGSTIRERTAAVLQEQLRRVGLAVDIVPSEANQMIGDFYKGNYDAMYFSFNTDSYDPARNLDFWMSTGSYHVWHPGQAKPATPWEASIDQLMRKQAATLDPAERRKIFKDVQMIFAEHLPMIYLAAAKATSATSARVSGSKPSPLKPAVLWNAEEISVSPAPPR